MPTRPLGPCAVRGCPKRSIERGLCAAHLAESRARYAAAHPDTRDSAAARGYDAQWRQTRKAFLRKHPTCSEPGCEQRATHVDHIKPKGQGGSDEWTNLQGLCHSHHSQKTARYDGAFGNPVRSGAVGNH